MGAAAEGRRPHICNNYVIFPRTSQSFSNFLKLSQIFSNLLNLSQIVSNLLNLSQIVSNLLNHPHVFSNVLNFLKSSQKCSGTYSPPLKHPPLKHPSLKHPSVFLRLTSISNFRKGEGGGAGGALTVSADLRGGSNQLAGSLAGRLASPLADG